jgi:hypothetical protein
VVTWKRSPVSRLSYVASIDFLFAALLMRDPNSFLVANLMAYDN